MENYLSAIIICLTAIFLVGAANIFLSIRTAHLLDSDTGFAGQKPDNRTIQQASAQRKFAETCLASSTQQDHLIFGMQEEDLWPDTMAQLYRLSGKETEVLPYLACGRSTNYIAQRLCLSLSTVKTHTYNIYRKMDVHTRDELIDIVEKFSKPRANTTRDS